MVRLLIFLFILITFNLSAAKKDKKPNFLFVLVDDQPHDAVGFSDRYPFLKTPNIDRLASDGVNIKNFFVTQSICSPSRASFLTGTYPHIHGVNQNNKHVDPDWGSFAPYSVHLKENGYETAHIGKIHMAHKRGKDHIRPGFDYWYSFIGQGQYFNPEVNDNGVETIEEGCGSSYVMTRTWTATDAREDESINGKAITIRDGKLTSPSITGGAGTITLTTQRKFGDSGSGDLIFYMFIPSDGNAGAANLTSSGTYVMYSWAEIPGFSKFGKYSANGNANGPYAYCGFRPAFIMIRKQQGEDTVIYDIKRDTTNVVGKAGRLYASLSNAQSSTTDDLDILSDGFKIRKFTGIINGSSGEYIFMAFAEQPIGTMFGLDANAR